MIKVKSIFDPVEPDDGMRIWVEPIGLTLDLVQWCEVDYVLPQLAPPLRAWGVVQENPDRYDDFAGKYHAWLADESRRTLIARLVALSFARQITLLHQGMDADRNSALVLSEFLAVWQERAGR